MNGDGGFLVQDARIGALPLQPLGGPGILERIPARLARELQVFPIELDRGVLRFAISDPSDAGRIDAVRQQAEDLEVEPCFAPAEEISRAIERYYDIGNYEVREDPGPGAGWVRTEEPSSARHTSAGWDRVLSPGSDEPITEMVRKLITDALGRRASDIHLEPLADTVRVRNRVDGILREVGGASKSHHASIVSRIKILSRLSIAERRRPQDGRLRLRDRGRDIDLRVSVVPTVHGESVVMRILDGAGARLQLADLGFDPGAEKNWRQLTTRSDGLLLVTGPTGSGKSTTLYSVLNSLNAPSRKIVTVEDPVECQIEGINQVAVHREIGMTFACAMRALLRQAPDILMVGEVRDRETADLAANAAMTGHLVLSTLHTHDACGAVTRLSDLGMKPFLIATALKGVLAQRLVRRICQSCRMQTEFSLQEQRLFERMDGVGGFVPSYKGRGCEACDGSGFSGRIGVFELLTISPRMQHAIHEGMTAVQMKSLWRSEGGRSLLEDGFEKVRAGLTTIGEVLNALSTRE
ncbi:MAG: type II/IV secretion system protein [Opitutaceae bacterium]|nr:type II/IV secretion system protein [Opitutaceae bacterium]